LGIIWDRLEPLQNLEIEDIKKRSKYLAFFYFFTVSGGLLGLFIMLGLYTIPGNPFLPLFMDPGNLTPEVELAEGSTGGCSIESDRGDQCAAFSFSKECCELGGYNDLTYKFYFYGDLTECAGWLSTVTALINVM